MAVGEEEELGDFEGCAEQGGGEKGAEGEPPPAVASYESLVKGNDKEEQSCKGGEYRKIPEVAVPISPRSEPIRDPPHLAHVRRRRQRANDDRYE